MQITVNGLPGLLKQFRQIKKLRLKDVSQQTGLSISHLSEVERGKTRPSLDTLNKLLCIYKTSVTFRPDYESS